MTQDQFKEAVKETALFKNKAIFAQKICLKHRVTEMYVYFEQAKKYGIDYLKQNPNILSSEVQIIDEILKNTTVAEM